jgi:hypothetical protein
MRDASFLLNNGKNGIGFNIIYYQGPLAERKISNGSLTVQVVEH